MQTKETLDQTHEYQSKEREREKKERREAERKGGENEERLFQVNRMPDLLIYTR